MKKAISLLLAILLPALCLLACSPKQPSAVSEKKIQIVTTLRQDALRGFVSKESPLGMALLGHRVGHRVEVHVNETRSYFVTVRAVEKGRDNEDLPISGF